MDSREDLEYRIEQLEEERDGLQRSVNDLEAERDELKSRIASAVRGAEDLIRGLER